MPRPETSPVLGDKPGALRLVPVEGDHMEPTLRRGDMVAVAPIGRFRGEGLYALLVLGVPVIHRCASDFAGGVSVTSDNRAYSAQTWTPDQFSDALLGRVAAVCTVLDPTLMPGGL